MPEYFHGLREEDASILYNAIGKVYSGGELLAAGLPLAGQQKQAGRLQVVLCVLPVGSSHAVDVSSDFHEGVRITADLPKYGHPMELCSGRGKLM